MLTLYISIQSCTEQNIDINLFNQQLLSMLKLYFANHGQY